MALQAEAGRYGETVEVAWSRGRTLEDVKQRPASRSSQTTVQPSRELRAKAGGGGGIRTRVRKYIPAGIYDAYPLLNCRPRREEAAKNRREPTPENLITAG